MTISDLKQMLRPRLLLLNTLAAFTGGLLFQGKPLSTPLLAAFYVLLLTAGATLLNQWQERALDARMQRTCHRPLADGRISATTGFLLALLFIGLGVMLLALQRPLAAAAGLLAIALYNGAYTLLKPQTTLALFPGAAAGAMPMVIGWMALGGSPLDYRILIPTGLIVLWQLPHFWLLAWLYREEYQRAGLPLLSDHLDDIQMHRLTRTWLWCLLAGCLLLPLIGLISHLPFQLALGATLLLFGCRLFRVGRQPAPVGLQQQFRDVNLLMLMVLLWLGCDSLLG